MSQSPRCVLLTNDDGPPDSRESPYVFGLYKYLTKELGWNVKVVLPSSQRSWIGKAYQIKEITKGHYYYPTDPDGRGETSLTSRPMKENELAEWILLDATPATCASIGVHNLYPGMIDLVISGPNLGRNSSSAFALSSGTIGAALAGSLSKVRSIALSYGTVIYPTPETFFNPAHTLSIKIINHLWHNWGSDEGGLRGNEVDFYNINIPLIQELLTEMGLNIYWTTMWRNSYGRLFKQIPTTGVPAKVNPAGPDAITSATRPVKEDSDMPSGDLVFKWWPQMEGLIRPPASSLEPGSDGWAIHQGCASVTPLRASFAEPPHVLDDNSIEGRLWRMKL
ncbi:cytoplasm protein [Moniliophthora roreri MCA 2997]|uniref:Cytoplasm protein n=1 Tax=Moniliophthora roreri (strain MCA 2997) TaxID=1381753 RepID=V2X8T6_MONRO|nr:cytoplasm protein [Moniliophthora roreri MCA 2997]